MSNEYGAIPLTIANAVGASLKKKYGSQTGFAPVDWAETINKLGNKLPERTVSGAVCSFADGADDVPMPSVKASITAVQAGSGDPSPSNVRAISGFAECDVTHTKKNLFDAEKIVKDSAHTSYVYIQDGYLRFTTGNLANKNFLFDNLKFPCPLTFKGKLKSFSSGNNIVRCRVVYLDGTTDSITLGTLQEQGELDFSTTIGTSGKTVFQINGNWTDDKAAGFDLSETQLEIGSTATDYESYAGETIPVWMGGVNIWDEEWEKGTLNNQGQNATDNSRIRSKNYIHVKPNASIYFFHPNGIASLFYYKKDKTFISSGSFDNSKAYTIPSECYYVRFIMASAYGATYNDDISVNYPATETGYNACRYIYGGELNLTTGVLTVTHGYIASYDGETINEPWISSIDKYVAGNSPSTGAQVVYPLTTPTTIQLTPEEVRSFLGTNNLWANTGDSEVTYFAQPSGGITPVFDETVICDNSSASSTLTFTEDWHDYDFLQFKLTNSSSGIITYITTTPDILDEIFAISSSKVLFNEYCNNQYITYTESSDPLVWTRKAQRSIDVTEVKGLTATNCTVSTEWIYKRGGISPDASTVITAPRYFEDYDEIYVATCDNDSDDTMPCILPVKGGTLAACNHYNDYHAIRLEGRVATDTYGKGETQYIFAMVGINYKEE